MIKILRCSLSLLTLFYLFFIVSCSVTSHRVPRTQESYVINHKRYYPIPSAEGYNEVGIASWYGGKFHGRLTSNGEIYNMYSMTAAHKTLPMNTMLLIKNLDNGKQTVVRINDRGPFVQGRIVDLSLKAAEAIGIDNKGIARVQAIALGEEGTNTATNTQSDAQTNARTNTATNTRINITTDITTKTPEESPALTYKEFSTGEFYVQIGTFTEKPHATRLQKRFADAGHSTVIQRNFESEPMRYMVQVYVGKTMQKAKRAEKALLENGYSGAFIIAR
jgi:rare lipoprotein A